MRFHKIGYAVVFITDFAEFALAGDYSLGSSAHAASKTALSKGDCLSRDAMMLQLGQEGQYPILMQEIIGVDGNNGDIVTQKEIFTSDIDLKAGLHIEVNGKGNYCVTGKLANIKLFNSLAGNFDKAAYFTKNSRNEAGTVNNSLDRSYKSRGEVPLLQAYSISSGNVLTVVGSPEGAKQGAVFISSPNGDLNVDGRYDVTNVSYGRLAKENLKRLQK